MPTSSTTAVSLLPTTNFETFDSHASLYAGIVDLFPGEAQIVNGYRDQFSGNVLDIAIGAGRTTRAIFPSSRSYLGLDYSPSMIERARQVCPDADLRVMDMCDVPETLKGVRFDVVLISFNGIDYIPWQSRERLLRGLGSLVSEGGILVFSTHDLARAGENSRFRLRKDLRLTPREMLTRPRRVARSFVRGMPWVWRAWCNRRRNRLLQVSFDGYAVVNDDGDDYGLLTIYVSRERQMRQLVETGWQPVEVVPAGWGDEPEYMHYFVARPERR